MLVRKANVRIKENIDADALFNILCSCERITLVYESNYNTIFEKLDMENPTSSFTPVQGVYLLDCSYETYGNFLHIKEYSHTDLIEIILLSFKEKCLNADGTQTTDTCSTSDFSDSYHVLFHMNTAFYKKSEYYEIDEEWLISYPNTITCLHNENKIQVRKSKSFLATDERIFSIDGEEWFEVDILGTLCGTEISEKIEILYSDLITL